MKRASVEKIASSESKDRLTERQRILEIQIELDREREQINLIKQKLFKERGSLAEQQKILKEQKEHLVEKGKLVSTTVKELELQKTV